MRTLAMICSIGAVVSGVAGLLLRLPAAPCVLSVIAGVLMMIVIA
jgi:hypothetical protein